MLKYLFEDQARRDWGDLRAHVESSAAERINAVNTLPTNHFVERYWIDEMGPVLA